MKTSHIQIKIELDSNNVPETIYWNADDKPEDFPDTTKAMILSLWDDEMNSILKTSLWTKNMLVGEMKRFFIQTIGGMAETLKDATGDERMFDEVQDLCERLAKIVNEQERMEKR